MRGWSIAAGLLALVAGGAWLFWTGPVASTVEAGLKAFPVYSFVRVRNEQLARIAHALGPSPDAVKPRGLGFLVHRDRLATPRDRSVTTPNTDTLYSSAFLALGNPMLVGIPGQADRYQSVAIMDARTDHVIIAGTRDDAGAQLLLLCAPDDRRGTCGTEGRLDDRIRVVHLPTDEAWLLMRVEVKGADDIQAARAVQAGFSLGPAPEAPFADWPQPAIQAVLLPPVPDPATLLRRANPVIARHSAMQDTALAATGYGGAADAFDTLPAWRQWLWRIVWPRVVARMQDGIAAGSRTTDDGWSATPPGIGTADATPAIRAAVALGGLAALPADEAIYWTATQDSERREFDGKQRYRLRIPQPVPAGAFWSVTLYERRPDGRLFFVASALDRYAIGNRTPGLVADADGTLSVTLSASDPGTGANWLPTPAGGAFTLVFRAYLPEPSLSRGEWRLPPVERLP